MTRKLFVGTMAMAIILVGTLAFSLVWAAAPQTASAQGGGTTALPRTVTVVGEGTASAAPDQAVLNVGVQTSGTTVQEAMAQNNNLMNGILAALSAMDIEAKDIQTTNFSIYFERTPTVLMSSTAGKGEATAVDETPAMQGEYRVSNMVEVTIHDLGKVSTVLDGVVEAGANNIWGVNFTISDPKALMAEARVDAVADARARAEELAALHGVSLGEVVSISEVIGSVSGYMGGEMALMSASAAYGGGAPVSPGELEYTFRIQVTYTIQ